MALTLRLTDAEKTILNKIEPDIGTASGTIKYMIEHWQARENEIAVLKRKLQDTERALALDQARLDTLRNAWQVFESLAKGPEQNSDRKTGLSAEERELKRIREGRAALEKAGQQKLWGDE
jgi:hypothetical protein